MSTAGPAPTPSSTRSPTTTDDPDGWDITPATQGGNGGDAGSGGAAGRSGDGGKGGTVTITTLTALVAGQVTSEITGGNAGSPAAVGAKGTIGRGGRGGRIAEQYNTGGHFNEVVWQLSDNRQGGSRDGTPGTDGALAPAAVAGAAGTFRPDRRRRLGSPAPGRVPAVPAPAQHEDRGDRLLREDFVGARSSYVWISSLTSQASGTTGLPAEFAGLYRQCRALLSQMSQGLDFFGNPMNYVPIVSLDYYQYALDGMLATGAQIENVYNAYTLSLQDQSHNFTQMQEALDRANDVITAAKAAQANLQKQIETLGPVVDGLTDSLVAQLGVLLQADADFQAAAQKIHGQCNWANLLLLLKTIVTIGFDAYGLWNATTWKDWTTPIKDFLGIGIDFDSGKLVQSPFTVAGDVPSIAGGWNTINPNQAPDVDDSKKLVVKEQDFDNAIKPYLDLPEAQAYKAAVHDYIGLAQSRNTKLLEYTNALVQYLAITGQLAQKEAEAERIKTDMATENIPGLIPYRNFLFGLYQDFKAMCLKYLYQENRAYIYWSQTDNPFTIADDSFTGLGVFHSGLKAKIVDQINDYSQPTQPLDDVKVVLSATGGRAQQFLDLAQSNAISFQLSTDDDRFLGWANVLLTNFKVFIPGVDMPTSGNLYVQLWHHGRVFVISPVGVQQDFSHNQVLSVFEYTLKDGVPTTVAGGSMGGDGTGGDAKRIALSPYATFTISLPTRYNPGLVLTGVQQVELHFSGYAVPRTDAVRRYA